MLNNKLLLVDDEPFSLKMFRDLFGQQWKVFHETTPPQILERIEQESPNLILLNLIIRRTDGEPIFHAIQSKYPKIPIVVYAPTGQARLARSLVKQGAFWYLTMPLNTDDLEHVMNIALRMQENQRTVVDTRRDFEQLESGIARLFAPLKGTLAKSFSFESNELVQGIIELLGDILQVERVSLMLVDHDREELRIKAAKGLTPYVIQKTIKKIGEGIAGSVARDGHPLLIKDVQQESKFSESAFFDQYSTRSLISVPLKVGDKVFGVLSANNKYSGKAFDENDLYLTTIFSHLLLLTLHNTQLNSDRERTFQREIELNQLSRKMSGALEPKMLFHTILAECGQIFAADLGFLFLLDEKSTDCTVYYLDQGNFVETKLSPSLFKKWLPSRDQQRLIRSETEAKEFEVLRNIVRREIQTSISAPLVLQERLAGSIELASFDRDRFYESDTYALLRIAQQAALAINNSRLYVKLLNSLKEISEARKEVERVRRGQYL